MFYFTNRNASLRRRSCVTAVTGFRWNKLCVTLHNSASHRQSTSLWHIVKYYIAGNVTCVWRERNVLSGVCLGSQREREAEGKWLLGSKVKWRYPVRGLEGSLGFHEVAALRFPDNRHTKVAKLPVLRSGRLYAQYVFLLLIYVRDWAGDPRVIVRSEGVSQYKVPMTPPGIETVTFRLLGITWRQLEDYINTVYRNKIAECWLVSSGSG